MCQTIQNLFHSNEDKDKDKFDVFNAQSSY